MKLQIYWRYVFCIVILSYTNLPLYAQFDFRSPTNSATTTENFDAASNDVSDSASVIALGEETTQRYRAGIKFKQGTNVGGLRVVFPVPRAWGEEQKVRVVNDSVPPPFVARLRGDTGLAYMELTADKFRPLADTEVVFTYEVTRRERLPLSESAAAQWQIPKKLPSDLEAYFRTESPKIEHRSRKFADLFQQITQGIDSDWKKVEAIYDYVRERFTYDDSYKGKPAKGAYDSITDGKWQADCKDMTFVFVAICRAGKIPARTVRLPTHCYAEFYLEKSIDAEEQETDSKSRRRRNNNSATVTGSWFPCQLAGDRDFGSIRGGEPILQRGDNYSFTELDGTRVKLYYFTERLEAAEVITRPSFSFIHEQISE